MRIRHGPRQREIEEEGCRPSITIREEEVEAATREDLVLATVEGDGGGGALGTTREEEEEAVGHRVH